MGHAHRAVVGLMPPGFDFSFPLRHHRAGTTADVEAYVSERLVPANQVRGRDIGDRECVRQIEARRLPASKLGQKSAGYTGQDRCGNGTADLYRWWRRRVQPLQERLRSATPGEGGSSCSRRRYEFVLLIACVISPTCCSLAPPLDRRRWRCGWRSVLDAVEWPGNTSPRDWSSRTAGGLLGLLLARVAIRAMLAMGLQATPRFAETTLDTRVLGFTLAISLLTGILFGLGPAFSFSQGKLYDTLKAGGHMSPGPMTLRLRQVLVSGELALALVLLIGAGLMLKSFWKMNTRPAPNRRRRLAPKSATATTSPTWTRSVTAIS